MKKQAGPAREKERRILDAAHERFAAAGYAKATMDEIAADVGLSKPSLYYYFPTKESVFRAVVKREQAEFLDRAACIINGTASARDKAMQYITLRLDLAERLMNLNRTDQYAWHDVHPIFNELFQSFGREEEHCLLRILRDGAASHEFTIAKPKCVAAMILHVLQGLRLRLVKMAKHSSGGTIGLHEWRGESLLCASIILDGITTTAA